MARIIWMFWNIIFLGRIMEFQVQFWHPSDLRLWRTGYVIYVKIDWWNSNAHCSRTCLQRKINKIIDPSTPQNHLQSHISMWDTLYYIFSTIYQRIGDLCVLSFYTSGLSHGVQSLFAVKLVVIFVNVIQGTFNKIFKITKNWENSRDILCWYSRISI